MPVAASLLASALYLLPVAAVVAVRGGRAGPRGSLGADVACAVAMDLLVILLLARVMLLDQAVLLSRALWAAGAAVVAVLQWRERGRAAGPPRAWGLAGALAAAGALGFALSAWRAHPYAIWDRQW